MATEKKFIKRMMENLQVKRYLNTEVERAGISNIEIERTPIATRVALFVRKPGMVVGKKGMGIQKIAETLQQVYKLENPQIEVIEVQQPELDAKLMAERIARQIEVKGNIKQVLRMSLNDIMSSGAIGAEIYIAGKVVGKGGKAKGFQVRSGYLKKSGHLMEKLVRLGKFTAYPKAGAIGVQVRIVPPGTTFPDKIDISNLSIPEAPAGEAAAVLENPEAEKRGEQKIEEARTEKVKRVRKKKENAETEKTE
ncbi:MAG TPA: 30S ribosomal protein S3 [Candidatus Norongarragalinales archaeon]|nr:30S ribosomal protein S3 [Candidatus Norongarragalinales archaeon]